MSLVLRSNLQITVLPEPDYGNSFEPVLATKLSYSMSGKPYTFNRVSANTRLSFKWSVLTADKARELKLFCEHYGSSQIRVTWGDQDWIVRFIGVPQFVEPLFWIQETALDFEGVAI